MKNKYVFCSRISEAKFRQIVRCFALDLNATQITYLTKVNRNTINRYLMEMRRIIYVHCLEIQKIEVGEIECR
jgi:transposase